MPKGKRMRALLILLATIFLLGGCWNYQEVEQVAIVVGLAVDKNEQGYFVITAEVIRPGEDSKVSSTLMGIEGINVFDGVRRLVTRMGKRAYFSHCKVIIINEEIAREDIRSVLDWVHRDPEVRSDTKILISRGQKAYEILQAITHIENATSLLLSEILASQVVENTFLNVELYEFFEKLAQEGVSPVVPTTNILEYQGEKVLQIYGTAVFNRDRMVGWLNGQETKSLSWLLEEYYQGLLVVEQKEDANIAYEVFSKHTEMAPVLKDDQLVIQIKIRNNLTIASLKNVEPDFQDEHRLAQLEIEAENYLERQILQIIEKVQQEYKTDIFGFGAMVQRKMPDYWKRINQDWDKELPKVKIEVLVDSNIDGSGFNLTPLKVRY